MGAQTYANMVSSATWGTFCCCQLICYVGYHRNWYSTFPVSVLAASLGVAGCETAGCWTYLVRPLSRFTLCNLDSCPN